MHESDPSELAPQRYDWYSERNREAIQTDVPTQENQFDAYLIHLVELFPDDRESIEWAYTTARKAHGEQSKPRQSGQLYFGHVMAVTRIAVDELHIRDPACVTALLLHDVGEDTAAIGGKLMRDMSYADWKVMAAQELVPHIGEEACDLFFALTRPQPNNLDILTKEDGRAVNNAVLLTSEKYLLLKSTDVLDNMRTLEYCDEEKQNRTIQTLRDFYIPHFIEQIDGDYGKNFHYVLSELMIAIGNLKKYQRDHPEREKEAS